MGRLLRSIAAIACALTLAGCIAPKDFDGGAATIRLLNTPAESPPATKTVYFVTTRCTNDATPVTPGSAQELFRKRCWDAAHGDAEMLRLGFGMAESGKVTCGSATVTVATNGTAGAATTVGTPVLVDCAALAQAVTTSGCRCAFMLVHGYNTTIGYGLRRTAQLALDLDYEGVPVLFSFAAGGRFADYANDAEAVDLAAPALHQQLLALSSGTTLDVIAHSMGARMTLRALRQGAAPTLRYVVLAAPDVDPAEFLRLASAAAPSAKRITVYTAKYDVAMSGSAATHGGHERTGEGLAPGTVTELQHAEIIDATERATDPYAHSYFAESKIVLDDIKTMLHDGTPAQQRAHLNCTQAGAAVSCKIPCPDGLSCGPTLYQRFVHWLLD